MPDGFDEFGGEGGGGRGHHSDGAEVVFADEGVFCEEEDDGWDDVGECYAVGLDGGAE